MENYGYRNSLCLRSENSDQFLKYTSPYQVSPQLTLSVNPWDTSSTTMPSLESYESDLSHQWNMGLMTMLQSHRAQQEQLKRIPILESQLETAREDNGRLRRRIAALEDLETEKQVTERDEKIERLEETNRNIKENFKKYKEESLLVDLEKMKQCIRNAIAESSSIPEISTT